MLPFSCPSVRRRDLALARARRRLATMALVARDGNPVAGPVAGAPPLQLVDRGTQALHLVERAVERPRDGVRNIADRRAVGDEGGRRGLGRARGLPRAAGDTDDGGALRHLLGHHRVGADARAAPDLDGAQALRAGAAADVVFSRSSAERRGGKKWVMTGIVRWE